MFPTWVAGAQIFGHKYTQIVNCELYSEKWKISGKFYVFFFLKQVRTGFNDFAVYFFINENLVKKKSIFLTC